MFRSLLKSKTFNQGFPYAATDHLLEIDKGETLFPTSSIDYRNPITLKMINRLVKTNAGCPEGKGGKWRIG